MTPATITPFALFEDNLAEPAHGLLLQDYLLTLDCLAANQIDAFFSALEQHREGGHWVALIAQYELGSAFESHASAHPTDAYLARALVFKTAITLDALAQTNWWQAQLAGLSPQACEAGILHLSPTLNRHDYTRQANRVLDYIRAGDCYQVNLSFPMTGEYFGHPLALYAKLREAQAVKHGALLFDGNEWLLSRSPELFFERSGSRLTCRPMKGTAPRGQSPEADAANGAALQSSEKNRAENIMIVDLIRNDLGQLAKAGDVHVTRLFELETYATVFQLTSSVEANPVDAPLSQVFRALFPCGSVTGAPKIRAMQIIHELETSARGPYCGALGWIAPSGDASFNVPIRTLRLQTNNTCRMDIGSGIVADSDPDDEYAECLTKARFISDDGLELIETLRCEIYRAGDTSESLPLIAWHLQRLARSAQTLRFQHHETNIRDVLFAHASGLAQGLHRVRLALSRDGTVKITSAPLDALAERSSVILSKDRLDPEDQRLQHKTTARHFYDKALRSAMADGHFDVIYLNTRNEVCEGARSNIFIERDGMLLTPPSSCGLLPGVMRAQLLAAGSAREAVITLNDLKNAERIYVGNALRGLIEVQLRD